MLNRNREFLPDNKGRKKIGIKRLIKNELLLGKMNRNRQKTAVKAMKLRKNMIQKTRSNPYFI